MDQLKDILKQAIKYRFWIAVGISALLPIIAYVVGSGPIKEETAKETKKIVDAKKDVDQFQAPGLPNKQWKPLVDENTAVVVKDVNASWTKLYDRQAPLMTWPEVVQERFREWGRAWPESEKEDASRVQLAIVDYVNAYPEYVTDVYSTFQPFDYETGKGIVAGPPEKTLLRPADYDVSTLPDLGKVWANQERLWLQRTLLQVIADVNANAKDWRSAKIKQINLLEVGNSKAQDQVSMAKGDELEEAPSIVDPKAPPPPVETAAATPMSTMPGVGGMSSMGGGQQEKTDTIFYIKNPSTQYKIMPVAISVLTEQDHIQDFLCALENSPMAIQVMEFEMSKPGTRVEKPEIGGGNTNFAGYAGMMGRGQMTGFGGNAALQAMQKMYAHLNAAPRGAASAEPARGGGTGKSGTSIRSENRKANREEIEKKASKTAHHSVFDPYFNIVEVKVYAQARFYNPPPKLPPAEPSTAAATETPATEAPKTEEAAMPKAEGETPKTETPKTEGETPKTETPKTETPKTEGETPKADDAAKPAAPKAETPEPAK